MKNNPIYTVIYIVLLIALILISFYVIKILYMISCAPLINDVFGPARDYIIYEKQPVMWLPILIYNIINFALLHKVYVVILCIAAFALWLIIVCWLIGLILQKIIFTNPFENIPPWRELREEGFFKWLLEKTDIEKNKDIVRFILNIFRSVLTPEEYQAAEERCLGTGASKESEVKASDFGATDSITASADNSIATLEESIAEAEEGIDEAEEGIAEAEEGATAATGADKLIEPFIGKGQDAAKAFAKAFNIPQPYSEYIDYNLEQKYKDDGREKDLFYRNSYLSIKQRADANSYRNMVIVRPDMPATIPELPDMENIINTEVNYVNIRLG